MTLDLEHMKRVAEALNPSTPINEWQQACYEATKPEFGRTVLRMLEGLALLERAVANLDMVVNADENDELDRMDMQVIYGTQAAYNQWKER